MSYDLGPNGIHLESPEALRVVSRMPARAFFPPKNTYPLDCWGNTRTSKNQKNFKKHRKTSNSKKTSQNSQKL